MDNESLGRSLPEVAELKDPVAEQLSDFRNGKQSIKEHLCRVFQFKSNTGVTTYLDQIIVVISIRNVFSDCIPYQDLPQGTLPFH